MNHQIVNSFIKIMKQSLKKHSVVCFSLDVEMGIELGTSTLFVFTTFTSAYSVTSW